MISLRRVWLRMRAMLGAAGITGLAALTLAATGYFITVQPRYVTLAALQSQVAGADAAARARPAPRMGDAAARLDALKARFPARDTLNDWIEKIEGASAASGAIVERAEYRHAGSDVLTRYQIALPVKGSYAQLRTYVGELLTALPALAVTEVEMRRDGVGAPTLDARINATLFLRGGER